MAGMKKSKKNKKPVRTAKELGSQRAALGDFKRGVKKTRRRPDDYERGVKKRRR